MRKGKTRTQLLRSEILDMIEEFEGTGLYVSKEDKKQFAQLRYNQYEALKKNDFYGLKQALMQAQNDKYFDFKTWKDVTKYGRTNLPDEGEIILDNIYTTIDMYDERAGEILRKGLKNQIKKYGLRNVQKSLASQQQDMVESARQIVVYSKDKSRMHKAIYDFFTLIKDSIPKEAENKMLGDIMDSTTDMGNES